MSDTFLIERALAVAERLSAARCWHQNASAIGSRLSTKWWDLLPADVAEAAIRLRELASAIDARGIEAQSGETAKQARSEGRKPGHEVTRHDTGGQQQRNGK